MAFFRKRASGDEKQAASKPPLHDLKGLTARRDEELRALGELYYQATAKGKNDKAGIGRCLKELERLDARIESLRAPKLERPLPGGPSSESKRIARIQCKCGLTFAPGDRFCVRCGMPSPQPLGSMRPCPICNRSVAVEARFCNFCGASMTSAGRIRVRHPLTGQEASFDFQPSSPRPSPSGALKPPRHDFDEPSFAHAEPDFASGTGRDQEHFVRPSHLDGSVLVKRGRELLDGGRNREAAAEFEGALLQNARDGQAAYFLGVARYKCGDIDSAVEGFELAIRLDRSNSDAYNDLGLCYARKIEGGRARENYEHALRLDPSHADAHYNLAHLLIQQMAYADAIPHLQMYLKNSPRAHDFKRVMEMIDQLQAAISSGARMGAESMLPPR